MKFLIWTGIFFCISQSAMFSGLNLAFFSVSKLRLEIESSKNNANAKKILALRQDANFLLTTILWGNVGINVLLTLLSDSILAGIYAFLFSTILITFVGEIIPQAYFSRHAINSAALLSPVLRIYQILLFPVAKPTAIVLDKWLGFEVIQYFREKDFSELIKMHVQSPDSDIDTVEGIGVINFLAIDELPIIQEGESIDPKSIIAVPFEGNKPVFPELISDPSNEFLKSVHASGKKWVILTDQENNPRLVINADGFLREAFFHNKPPEVLSYCHRPIIIRNDTIPLGDVLRKLKVHPKRQDDDVIDQDIVIVWTDTKRIITGSDVLGRLLRDIVQKEITV